MSVVEFEPEHLERFQLPRAPFTGTYVRRVTVESIQGAVADFFKVRLWDLKGEDRHQSVALARHVAIYLCKEHTGASYPELGRAFGNRDHTTAMAAHRKIRGLRETDPRFALRLAALEEQVA
jgi:chromosomal replication initiator protein